MTEREPKPHSEPPKELKPLFELGRVVVTQGYIEAIIRTGDDPFGYLVRHATGDWGELPDEDKALNEYALDSGGQRLFSRYLMSDETKIYVITEWDRSVTTLLLPEEY